MWWFIIVLAFIWLIFAIVQDLKKREIANWLNFSLILFVIAFRLFYSIFSNDYRVLLYGLFGLCIFFLLGHLFYYAKFFAGGDAKLFIAFGAIVPLSVNLYENLFMGLIFLTALFFCGAVYSIFYSIFLSFSNKKQFLKEFREQFYLNEKYLFIGIVFAILFFISALVFNESLLFTVSFLLFVLPLLYIYTKAVEKACMIKSVDVKALEVGDWLVNEIKVKSKTIKPLWEGVSQEDIDFLKKNYKKKILVKYGIPFSPSFLFAFFILLIFKYYIGFDFFWGV